MCGIFGCFLKSKDQVSKILVVGLQKLLYRGYDSWGYTIDNIHVRRSMETPSDDGTKGRFGIAHTRWATHGEPCIRNTHPVQSPDGKWFVVHNGIIQNHDSFDRQNHVTDTDTEVLVSLAQHVYTPGMTFPDVIKKVISVIDGSYAVLFTSTHFPNEMVATCNGSPLVFGTSEHGVFFSSDHIALSDVCKTYMKLENRDVIHVHDDTYTIENVRPFHETVHSKDLFNTEEHYMLKEIREQPQALIKLYKGRVYPDRVRLGGLEAYREVLERSTHWVLLGCGTSHNACLCVRPLLENHLQKTVQCELASDFFIRDAHVSKSTLYFIVSQSGETKDCITAAQYINRRGGTCFGINNRPGSMLDSHTVAGLHLNIGPEIAVAATKSFTASVVAFLMIAEMIKPKNPGHILELPNVIEQHIERCLHEISGPVPTWVLGDGIGFGIAREIALKIQEIVYEPVLTHYGYEVKHGPLALVDEKTRFVYFGHSVDIPSILKSRGAQGDAFTILESDPWIFILRHVISYQIFTYKLAKQKGLPIDRPRNLAKSVTV